MIYLRQSTASQEIPLGRFMSPTDLDTTGQKTALTIANTDIKLWKAGATTLASKNSGGGTHIANGVYYAVLDETDTDTAGTLKIFVHVAGSVPFDDEYCVLPANVYDSFVTGTDQVTASDIADAVVTAMEATSTKLDVVYTKVTSDGVPLTAGAVDDVVAAINADTTDGTITWAQQKIVELAVLGGDATGLLGSTKVFKNQAGTAVVTSAHSGGSRTVTLTP